MGRKIAALLLLALLIFNLGGYFILARLLEVDAERRMSARIENGDIRDEERVEVRLPFELPYPVYNQEVELSGTRVTSGGQSYSIIGQSYEDNTLTLVGVRDQWAMHVSAVMDAYNSSAAQSTDESLVHGIGNLLQNFLDSHPTDLVQSGFWVQTLSRHAALVPLTEGIRSSLVKPPSA